MIGEPPSLDLHTTTAVITQQITWHIYETLYTYDKGYQPIPMLAEGHTVSDRGRTYTFKLRRGVKFHNGKEMTAADVVASLKHWGKLAGRGKAVSEGPGGDRGEGPVHRRHLPEGADASPAGGPRPSEQCGGDLSEGGRRGGR